MRIFNRNLDKDGSFLTIVGHLDRGWGQTGFYFEEARLRKGERVLRGK